MELMVKGSPVQVVDLLKEEINSQIFDYHLLEL